MHGTSHASAVAATLRVLEALQAGRVPELPELACPVTLVLAPGEERVLGVAPFDLATYGPDTDKVVAATGPRSWTDGTTVAVPGLQVDLGGLATALRLARNPEWRSRLAEALHLRWYTAHHGVVTVTTHGIYLDYGMVVHPWSWDLLSRVQLVAPATVQYVARGADGTLPWRLTSVWAELVLVLWAWNRQPDHPQLHDDAWVPPSAADGTGWTSATPTPTSVTVVEDRSQPGDRWHPGSGDSWHPQPAEPDLTSSGVRSYPASAVDPAVTPDVAAVALSRVEPAGTPGRVPRGTPEPDLASTPEPEPSATPEPEPTRTPEPAPAGAAPPDSAGAPEPDLAQVPEPATASGPDADVHPGREPWAAVQSPTTQWPTRQWPTTQWPTPEPSSPAVPQQGADGVDARIEELLGRRRSDG